MTAPAAPVIHVHSLGNAVRVSYPAVPGAATYDIYAGPTSPTTTLAVSGATGTDPVFLPLDEVSYIRVKAVNAGAEASAYSNEVRVATPDSGRRFVDRDPFGAKDRRDY